MTIAQFTRHHKLDTATPNYSNKAEARDKYKYTNTQIHKYTNTQIHIHKYTNSQIQKYTNTNTQIHNYKHKLPIIPIRQGTL